MKRVSSYRLPSSVRCGGFTLTELAIVLGVFAAIVSAVWVAGASAWTHYKVSHTIQQILESVDNIRSGYVSVGTWTATGWTDFQDVTQNMDKLGLFPPEMRANPATPGATVLNHTIRSLAAGSFHVYVKSSAVTGNFDNIRFSLQGFDHG